MPSSMAIFRSVVLTSAKPEHTALFYQFVVGLDLEAVGGPNDRVAWTVECGNIEIAIHHTDSLPDYASPPLHRSNLTHLYFKLESHEDFLEHLDKLGIAPMILDGERVAVEDPDGRMVIFGSSVPAK